MSGALDLHVSGIRSLRDIRNQRIAEDRARAYLSITTAALVVFLAAFGFYGTQRYLVESGRREYAIRASLGAGPSAIRRLVLARSLLLSAPGLVLAGLLAYVTVAWIRGDYLTREITPGIVTLWLVAALAAILLAASWSPARTAERTQPAPLLRED